MNSNVFSFSKLSKQEIDNLKFAFGVNSDDVVTENDDITHYYGHNLYNWPNIHLKMDHYDSDNNVHL